MWNRGEYITWDLEELSRVLDDGGLIAAWFLLKFRSRDSWRLGGHITTLRNTP